MTRIRYLFQAFRARRQRRLSRSNSMSFEAFCNEAPQQRQPQLNESTLSGDFYDIAPFKREQEEDEYVCFSEESQVRPKASSLMTSLLLISLISVFLIIPCLYLLGCFKMIYIEEHYQIPDVPEHTRTVHRVQADSANTSIIRSKPLVKKLPPPPKPDYNQCKPIPENDRLDCFPDDKATLAGCEARGCCWIPAKTKPKFGAILNVPYCFYPSNYNTYNYVNVTETAFGLVALLTRTYATPYPNTSVTIQITIKYEAKDRLHIMITDPSEVRYETPYPEVPVVDKAAVNVTYQVYIDSTKSGFRVIRKSDNAVIFDTLNLPMIFSNQFIELSAKLPSFNIYGLGEHQGDFLLSTEWSRFTLFNHDAIPGFNKNLYGSHPFYMVMENSGKTHGVLLLNSNAMDIILQPSPIITFRTIGGILDFYYFLGPAPSDVISQYTELIGRPFMPPYWGLGFHLCRFGYKTLNRTKQVMQRNIDAGIPLDTQWNDLDYMKNSNDFTYDTINFEGLPAFVSELHKKGMHYIPLIDPGVSGSEPKDTYPPYDVGVKMDIFVKNSTGGIFIGKVWNNASTVWPDFTHPNTVDYWTLMLRSYHDQVAFDGAWIDMNEPSNFLSGSFTGCPESELENPPYLPAVDGGALNHKTLCMTARHYLGLEYDLHNLYGFTEATVTNFALSEIRGKRPMVISRSTFVGFGQYAGHWSGDVVSDWSDMRYSIPQLLRFSLFGIPLMGADICGFNGNTTSALCNRWMQLGAFYPFSRNHNTDDGIDQDPVAMGPQVTASSRKALRIRYSLLPYLYTLFWGAHTRGETVARPLLFEFPNDSKTHSIDTQFLWGPALMIIPVLEDKSIQVLAYLPKSIWYDFERKLPISKGGELLTIAAPLDTIPLLVRGGFILPQQPPEQTTTMSRKNKIELLAASDEEGNGLGQLYWDDGDSLNFYEEKQYSLIAFSMENGTLRSNNIYWGAVKPPNLGAVHVLGVGVDVKSVTVNNMAQPFRYDGEKKYLSIVGLDVTFEKSIVVVWNFK